MIDFRHSMSYKFWQSFGIVDPIWLSTHTWTEMLVKYKEFITKSTSLAAINGAINSSCGRVWLLSGATWDLTVTLMTEVCHNVQLMYDTI